MSRTLAVLIVVLLTAVGLVIGTAAGLALGGPSHPVVPAR